MGLLYRQNESIQQMAGIREISEEAVRQHLSRGRSLLNKSRRSPAAPPLASAKSGGDDEQGHCTRRRIDLIRPVFLFAFINRPLNYLRIA